MANAFKDQLKKAATPTLPKASKSTVPNLDVPADVKAAAARYIAAVKVIKEKEAEAAIDHSTVSTHVRKVQDEKAFAGNFNKSYRIPLEGDDNLMVTTVNKFKINSDNEDTIKKLLGKAYQNLIEEKFTVTLKAEVLEDTPAGQALQKELNDLLGDNFGRFFDIVTKLAVKENFDSNIYSVAGTQDKLNEIRSYIEPQKSTLK